MPDRPTRTADPPRTLPETSTESRSPLVASSPREPAPLDEGYLPTEESLRAVFSSHSRAGRWEAADEIEVKAIFGEVKLDFTRAELPRAPAMAISQA